MKNIFAIFRRRFVVVLEVGETDVILSQPTSLFSAVSRFRDLNDHNPYRNQYRIAYLD